MEAASLAQVVELASSPAPQSVLQQLRDNATRRRANDTQDVKLPDYEGLYVTFKILKDYTETRDDIAATLGRNLSKAELEIELSVQTLLLSSVSAYALVNGERFDIGHPLGVALYDVLWPPSDEMEARPQTDAEALFLLFDDNTVQITTLAAQLNLWFAGKIENINEGLLGES